MSGKLQHFPGRSLHENDWIRLINVLPGDDSEPLVLQLFETRISQAPSYEGLSYSWGDPSDTETTVSLSYKVSDRNETLYELGIKSNCVAALRRLRHGIRKPRCVWIDAICIFQKFTDERSHQVELMSLIYQNATRVVIYLGEEADGSDQAMSWISELAVPSDYQSNVNVWIATVDSFRDLRPNQESLEALFSRPWFKRTWVLQEVALARSAVVICGDKTIDWDFFQNFSTFNTSCRWLKSLPVVVEISTKAERRGPYARRLLRTLQLTRNCQATDPRDKLYALIPLLRLSERETGGDAEDPGRSAIDTIMDLKVDYHRTTELVFARLAAYLISQLGPDVMRHVWSSSPRPKARSWAPDWSMTSVQSAMRLSVELQSIRPTRTAGFRKSTRENPLMQLVSSCVQPPSARRDDETEGEWAILRGPDHNDIEAYRLRGYGVAVGEIQAIGDTCIVDDDYLPLTKWRRLVQDQQHLRHVSNVQWPSEDPEKEAFDLFTRVLTMDSIVYPEAVQAGFERLRVYDVLDTAYNRPESLDDYKAYMFQHTDKSTVVPMAKCMKGMPASYSRQAERILVACDGRRLFVTDTGYLGLAPSTAVAGDAVFVLRDASAPFVFRTISEGHHKTERQAADLGDDHVNLVGECYVLGVMEGEMYDGNPTEQRITIW